METNNKNLETLIKLRHLSEGLNSNWEALNTAKVKVAHLLDEANNIVKMFGSDLGKSKFQEDVNLIASLRDKIESQLAYFKNKIESQSSSDSSEIYKDFLSNTESVSSIFTKIGKYPDDYFSGMNSADWFGVWAVIQSNIYTVQGIGHSAFVQLQMFEIFSKQEIDDLTKALPVVLGAKPGIDGIGLVPTENANMSIPEKDEIKADFKKELGDVPEQDADDWSRVFDGGMAAYRLGQRAGKKEGITEGRKAILRELAAGASLELLYAAEVGE